MFNAMQGGGLKSILSNGNHNNSADRRNPRYQNERKPTTLKDGKQAFAVPATTDNKKACAKLYKQGHVEWELDEKDEKILVHTKFSSNVGLIREQFTTYKQLEGKKRYDER